LALSFGTATVKFPIDDMPKMLENCDQWFSYGIVFAAFQTNSRTLKIIVNLNSLNKTCEKNHRFAMI